MPAHQDTYAPDPRDTATCPHCGTVVPSVDPTAAHAWMAALFYRCPGCDRGWNENRTISDGIVRIWDPAAAPPA